MSFASIKLAASDFMSTTLNWVSSGLRAFTSCDYWDTGNKLGRQRVASFITSLNSGQQLHIGFRTGAEPVVVTARIIQQIGSTQINYSAQAKRTFSTSGATVVTPRNPNNVVNVPSGVSVWYGVTPNAADGSTVEYLAPYPVLAVGNNALSRIGTDVSAGKYTLAANTDHVFTFNNVGTGNASVLHWWLTFREGKSDLPVE